MSTEEVVKSVAKKLKYYFQIKRLEDGFDLSDVHQPLLSHPPLKARPAHQYDGLHDRALKHYFSEPEVKVMLTQLNSPNAREGLHGWREIEVRKKLHNYMKHFSFKKRNLQKCYYCRPSSVKPPATGILHKRKIKQKSFSGGLPVLRTVPDQHISKAEANRLVNSATKIICGSELNNPVAMLPYAYKKDHKQPTLGLLKTVSTPARSNQKKDKLLYHFPQSALESAQKTRHENRQVSKQARSRSTSPQSTRSSSASSYAHTSSDSLASTSSSTSSSSSGRASNKAAAKIKTPTIINMPDSKQQDEIGVMMSTQTAGDSDVDSKTGGHKADDEVMEGTPCEYQVSVSTGDRIGAGTTAPVKLTLYGEKGRTKEFDLNKLSKRHKIPFQKGNEDLFLLPAHHIGQLRKIQIGHDREELNYAWYLDKVTVFDKHAKRIYQFPCGSWLSGQDQDKKTYRILRADSEREFMEALDVSMAKSALKETDDLVSSNSAAKAKQPHKTKVGDDDGNNSRPHDSSRNRSDSPRISSNVRVESASSRYNQKGETQRKPKDDYKQRATKITLHSMPGSNVVDEIFLENGSAADTKIKQDTNSIAGYQSEQEKKIQLERKRQTERDLLKGKSIHDAVKDSDIDRVKELLHHFPEMRDLKNEKGWTPLHLAAASGNMEMLRWLVTSGADISAETPAGWTAMHLTALNGHVNAMMILQAMGASIFSLTKEKQSTLHIAAKSGHLECVKWLVANKASIDIKDSSGNTAFRLAEENEHESCASFLRICMQELNNPRSSFAQIQGRRTSGTDLPPIKEDAISGSSNNALKDDINVEVVRRIQRFMQINSQEMKDEFGDRHLSYRVSVLE